VFLLALAVAVGIMLAGAIGVAVLVGRAALDRALG
jgi:hypothetical protein